MEKTPKDMSIQQIMTTEIDTISESDTLVQASKKLAYANVGAMPVCDTGRHLKGIITDRDIVVAGIARGKDPTTTTVGEIETQNPISVSPDSTLDESLALMAQHRIRRLPVVVDGNVVGMLSQRDIVRTGDAEITSTMLRAISE